MSEKPVLCGILSRLMVVASITMVLAALGAGFLGVDTDLKWGPFRIAVLVLGLAGATMPFLSSAVTSIDRYLLRNRLAGPAPAGSAGPSLRPREPSIEEAEGQGPLAPAADSRDGSGREASAKPVAPRDGANREPWRWRSWVGLLFGFVLVETTYLGIVSGWRYTSWPQEARFYYSMLAEAFVHGRSALLVDPPAQLEELENPYTVEGRQGIPVLGDASYYRGKYYLYWGPAPAAVAALWMVSTGRPVGDHHITFVAVSATFIFSSLILLRLKKKYFSSLPNYFLVVGIVIVSTSHPMLWVLNSPGVNEAAIAGGQAFLLAGVFFSLPVVEKSRLHPWRLGLVGALWALALASRLTLIGVVAVCTVAMVACLKARATRDGRWQSAISRIGALGLPLAIGMGLLGLYNFVRFGDFLETGLRYQLLTPIGPGELMDKGRLFNLAYLGPNLLYYLAAPLRLGRSFPFVRAYYAKVPAFSSFLSRFDIPAEHYVDNAAGLLFSMPTILILGLMARNALCGPAEELPTPRMAALGGPPPLQRALWLLSLAVVAAAAPALVYYNVSTRFLLDAIPLLSLLVTIGVWWTYLSAHAYPLRRGLTVLAILLATAIASLVSLFLALNGAGSRFDDYSAPLGMFLTILISH